MDELHLWATKHARKWRSELDTADKKMRLKSEGYVTNIRFHPESRWIFAGKLDGTISVHELESGKNESTATLQIHRDACREIDICPDLQTLVTVAADKKICWTNIETRVVSSCETGTEFSALCRWDSSTVITGNNKGTVQMWDERARTMVLEHTNHGDFVSGLVPYVSEHTLISGGGDGVLNAWDLRKNRKRQSFGHFDDGVTAIRSAQDNKYLAVNLDDGSVIFFRKDAWSSPVGRFLRAFKCESMDILSDSKGLMCIGCDDGKIRSVLVGSQKCGVVRDTNRARDFVAFVVVSPDKKRLAGISYYDRHVYVYKYKRTKDREARFFQDLTK